MDVLKGKFKGNRARVRKRKSFVHVVGAGKSYQEMRKMAKNRSMCGATNPWVDLPRVEYQTKSIYTKETFWSLY